MLLLHAQGARSAKCDISVRTVVAMSLFCWPVWQWKSLLSNHFEPCSDRESAAGACPLLANRTVSATAVAELKA